MLDNLIAKGVLPDSILRTGIRKLLKSRLDVEYGESFEIREKTKEQLIRELKESPISIETDKANDQHYMVPPQFFLNCLGSSLKYSCCHWDQAKDLNEAEIEMLELTIQRSGIKDGDKILELGHGWGAITLFLGERFPNSEILAVSNSKFQGQFILDKAASKGIENIRIQTADVAKFDTTEKFDRVISIEMFEHMRNYESLLKNISNWLNPDGTLFVHIFSHKELAYKYEVKDETDWMSRYYFSGGIMPSEHLLYYFNKDLVVDKHWRVNGTHYAKTCRAWLNKMDSNKSEINRIFQEHYPHGEHKKWFNYWRLFFMSCEELFNYNEGREWFVSHYLFKKRG